MKQSLLFLLFLSPLFLWTTVLGHGVLIKPPSRPWHYYLEGKYAPWNMSNRSSDYCPHCLNGEGAGKKINFCGGPGQGETMDYDQASDKYVNQRAFKAGGVMRADIGLTKNHGGIHGVRMKCVDNELDKAPKPEDEDDGSWINLERVPQLEPGTITYDSTRPHLIFVPGEACGTWNETLKSEGARWDPNTDHKGKHFEGILSVYFRVPESLSGCNRTVGQWWWKTALTCNLDEYQDFMVNKQKCTRLNKCSTPHEMEQFRNCFDVQVLPAGADCDDDEGDGCGASTPRRRAALATKRQKWRPTPGKKNSKCSITKFKTWCQRRKRFSKYKRMRKYARCRLYRKRNIKWNHKRYRKWSQKSYYCVARGGWKKTKWSYCNICRNHRSMLGRAASLPRTAGEDRQKQTAAIIVGGSVVLLIFSLFVICGLRHSPGCQGGVVEKRAAVHPLDNVE